MSSLQSQLTERVREGAGIDPELRPATKPQFGHFQSNVALRLAKDEGRPPREVAVELVGKINVADLCEPVEVAGPGFLNFRLRADVLAQAASALLVDPHVGIEQVEKAQTVVIDYSAPNVAKQLHVGHLRSTIIGDCFRRVLVARGDRVIAQSHIGDWGRQFGMLVEQVLDEDLDLDDLDLEGAEDLYLRANGHLKADEAFAARSRDRVVLLQSGDPETRRIWQRLVDLSLTGFDRTYSRMNVLLTSEDTAGESIYNDMLEPICDDLEARGIAVHDAGALVAFADGFEVPAILRNSQGGYGYDVTDVAAVKYRVNTLHADRILYVVGAPQTLHFALIFAVARRAGYLPDSVEAVHVPFGQVLGPDGKKFSTREGTAVRLDSLLDDAEDVATRSVAMAAIKYADLSNQLQKDYTFDLERMTATTGDTGPYLQYAHARATQILRRAEAEGFTFDAVTRLEAPEEQALALALSRFGEIVSQVAADLQPHKLCTYLFDLASAMSVFYERCPVLKAEDELRSSRLALCAAVRRVLSTGLGLLGIEAPDQM